MVGQSQIVLSPQIDYDSQCQIVHFRKKTTGKLPKQDSKSVDHFTTQDAIEEERILKPPTTSSELAEINHSIQSTPQTNQHSSSSLIVELDPTRTTYSDLEQIRKTKRLLAMFRLWHSKTEMQQQQQRIQPERDFNRNVNDNSIRELSTRRIECLENNETTLSSTTSNHNNQSRPTSSSSCNYHNHISRRNHLMFIPTCASNMPFATNIMPENLSESLSERKLWQSLVMPLVLGCIIFLVIIWTRQISLVLMDDTIVMIVILGSVFILMSGIAFWLAQDQSMTENNNNQDQERQQQISTSNHDWSTTSTTSESNRHHCRFQHRSALNHQHSGGNQHQIEDDKRYNVSVIECQPPDYYSAMRNSFPVDIYCLKEKKKKEEGEEEHYENQPTTDRNISEVGSSFEIIDSDPPPSYREWSTLGGNMCTNSDDSHQRRNNNSFVSATSVKAPQQFP